MLVLHTAVGVAAVGAATHLVLWLRKYVRGQTGKRRAVLRFAWLVLALQLAAFIAGNVMYPTYKVEVRSAYLENAAAITAMERAKQQELGKVAAREGAETPQPTATSTTRVPVRPKSSTCSTPSTSSSTSRSAPATWSAPTPGCGR